MDGEWDCESTKKFNYSELIKETREYNITSFCKVGLGQFHSLTQ